MNVLENILEEMENESKLAHEEMRRCARENPLQFDEVKGYARAMEYVIDTIRSHMNKVAEDWIPVEERLPEEHDSIFANFNGTENWKLGMFEKRSDNVDVIIELEDGTRKTTMSYTLDGKWKIEKELGLVKKKVVAWRSLPKLAKIENV